MGVGGKHHALAALPPGQETRYPWYMRLDGPQDFKNKYNVFLSKAL
jgi:hypothetical protein